MRRGKKRRGEGKESVKKKKEEEGREGDSRNKIKFQVKKSLEMMCLSI